MILGVLAGAGLGILAAATALIYLPGGQPELRGFIFSLFIMAVWAGPGAILLSIPLSSWMIRLRKAGVHFGRRCLLGTTAGIPLGLINYVAVAALVFGASPLLTLDRGIAWFATAGVAGGAGLGLGSALGTLRPRKPREPSV